ncbi:cytochrome c maturation protein CcmE [Vibrio breoganii]|uniref:Cytochrome c-type biogenesis protein CcmE n=1 Tax=Vibrio breoganii TaxID=553239 RepID=A0AAN1CSG1_9VIBR|nr:cytochrome c maturation protein CcmE [Vibrio breoganii]ANO33274.1 cytochrome c biogenesis protein CcmE [Vibrio breoganii]MDN3716752.1 cytochrome c maturation protein CcmE [Vibrio breoganii]PMK47638.1 cytochrome c biogenesis protein CcmE [Vibrio breoganii]PMO29567.1 cytochrome c biogenesis protein CcmE [Vibrio breoganii]PMO53801.1 cytochrome c biogenesis protein CcmE [Vibrio breoganii]
MNPRRKKRMGLIVALLVGLGATIGLMLYALNQNMDLFYTPTEIVNGKSNGEKPEVGQRLRIGGMVVAGTVSRDSESLRVSFDVADIGPAVTVTYDGILPDLFREGQGIVAQGVLTDSHTVEAFEVLAKHDEEYMPPEVAEAMKVVHEPLEYTQEQQQGSAQ